MLSGSATATPAGAGGSAPPPAQVLSDLFDALATLMAAEVDAAARDQHNAEIAKVKDQITQGKADLAAEGYQDGYGTGRIGCAGLLAYVRSERVKRCHEEKVRVSPAAGL